MQAIRTIDSAQYRPYSRETVMTFSPFPLSFYREDPKEETKTSRWAYAADYTLALILTAVIFFYLGQYGGRYKEIIFYPQE